MDRGSWRIMDTHLLSEKTMDVHVYIHVYTFTLRASLSVPKALRNYHAANHSYGRRSDRIDENVQTQCRGFSPDRPRL
jgi:hypothetical protein